MAAALYPRYGYLTASMLTVIVLTSAVTIENHGVASLKSQGIRTSTVSRQAAVNDSSSLTQQASQQRLVEAYGKLPLSLELNQGQIDSRVEFLSRSSEPKAFPAAADFSASDSNAAPLLRLFPLSAAELKTNSDAQPTPPAVKPLTALINQIDSNPRSASGGLSNLPFEAQSSISRVLGRELPGYQARSQGSGFAVENARNNLCAEFTSAGVEMHSGNALWKLSLRSYGYGNALQPVPAVIPHARSNRVEYRHGMLTEWYVNGPLGLEQGFTLSERPHRARAAALRSFGIGNIAIDHQQSTIGNPGGQPLTITLAASGNLTAVVDQGRTDLTLTTADGQGQLRYTGLSARDSTGKRLSAWLQVKGEQLLLKVEDATAHYPLVIDPFTQLAKLTPSDPRGCCNVAVSGDIVVAGAIFAGPTFEQQGAAYVFVKPASGWANVTQSAKLTASDASSGDWFGVSVAISGNTVLIGAPQTISNVNNPGRAYVFVKPAGGWVDMPQTAELTASDGKPGDRFGQSVGIDGNTAIIGTSMAQPAYVFVQPTTGWVTRRRQLS
jgi:hypothetical protein